MMGSKARIFTPITAISLEELVPANHFYRHLDRVVDLSFVRDLVKETYAERRRPSLDPVVFFKLQLVMFFDDIRSERLLMQLVADLLSVRWYIGYNLDEPLPDHSSLTRIRERYGVELFQRFFEAIVDQCQQAGLVWGKELFVDATKVQANASLDSVKLRFAVDSHLRELFSTGEEAEPGQPPHVEPPLPMSKVATSPPEIIREEARPPSEASVSAPSLGESAGAAPIPLPSCLEDALQEDLIRTNEKRHDWIE